MKSDDKVYVAGHREMMGSAITPWVKEEDYTDLIVRSSDKLDLPDQTATTHFFGEMEGSR